MSDSVVACDYLPLPLSMIGECELSVLEHYGESCLLCVLHAKGMNSEVFGCVRGCDGVTCPNNGNWFLWWINKFNENKSCIKDRRMIFTFPVLILASLSRWFAEGALTNNKVDFRKLNITSVPSMAVDPSAGNRITRVVFSHNSIEELRDVDFDTLSQFPNTRYIFFDNNRISKVHAGTFSRLPKLKHIELSRNDLTELLQDFYDELIKLTDLKYVNLKRNPFCNFDNIYKLMEKGIDVDFDGMMNKNRKRRLVTESSVNDLQTNDLENSDELLDEDHGNRTKTDKPRKAFVVDTKGGKPSVIKNTDDKQSKTMESIIFNLFTAGLILVALPIGMVIYFLMNRRREYS